ncbi:MAG: 3-dehydroquinate dehydratase-2 [Candidatus Marivariicella framensis]|jgi:3-dehydroquinate dehydratase-2|tara:strand:- start:3541 stop:4023 length:483 start_codon:yes stop_codon:yes gene_type:complete
MGLVKKVKCSIFVKRNSMKISIINGPNLNLLGKREPNIYGSVTFEEYLKSLKKEFSNIEFDYFQSNIEGEIIDQLQKVGFSSDSVLLNAAAYTHTSVAIGDAIKAIDTPVIEIHISNTFSREDFRHQSFITPVAKGLIIGFGIDSYRLGILSLINQVKTK